MPKFKVEFNTDNAAFEDAPKQEVARILQKVLRQFDEGDCHRHIQDINGNTVGSWEASE